MVINQFKPHVVLYRSLRLYFASEVVGKSSFITASTYNLFLYFLTFSLCGLPFILYAFTLSNYSKYICLTFITKSQGESAVVAVSPCPSESFPDATRPGTVPTPVNESRTKDELNAVPRIYLCVSTDLTCTRESARWWMAVAGYE